MSLERSQELANEMVIVKITHEATGTGSLEQEFRDAQLHISIKSETHDQSAMMHVIKRKPELTRGCMRSITSWPKNGKQVVIVEWHKEGMSWVSSKRGKGRPSGIVLYWKSWRPSREDGPLELRRCLCLYLELMKVI